MNATSQEIRQLFAEAAALVHRTRVQADEACDLLIDALQIQRRSMRTLEELNAKLQEVQDAVEADEKEDAEHAAAMQTVIDDLQAKVDAGSIPADFQTQIDKLDEIRSKLSAPGTSTIEEAPGTPE